MLHNGRVDRLAHHVALLVATWANNDGTNAFMSLDSLAECAHASLSETQEALQRLQTRGYLVSAVASNGASAWELPIAKVKHERDEVAETRAAKRKKATQERTRKWREAKRVTQELSVTVTDNSSVTTESVTLESTVTQGSVTQELGVRDARVSVTPAGHSPVPPLTSIKEDLHASRKAEQPRDDVLRLYTHLRTQVAAIGVRLPEEISKQSLNDARLMLDEDGRDLDEALRVIDWCTQDDFWRGIVLSVTKLREKYDQLRLKASSDPRWRHLRAVESIPDEELSRAFLDKELGPDSQSPATAPLEIEDGDPAARKAWYQAAREERLNERRAEWRKRRSTTQNRTSA